MSTIAKRVSSLLLQSRRSNRWKSSTATEAVTLGMEVETRTSPKGHSYIIKSSTQQKYLALNEPTVQELMSADESLRHLDYFQVQKLFTVKDLFDSRVHLGHKEGGLHPNMTDFVFGHRFQQSIIDLDKTAFHLRQALNFLAHIAFRKGIILFVTRSPQTMQLVENTAIECGEYAHCRDWDIHTMTNSERKFGGITRLPDTIVLLSTLNTVMAEHLAIRDAAKMLIPTVGIVDTNCDPNLITYPVPGNDDSLQSIQLYCKLFKEAILRGKAKRKQIDELNQSRSQGQEGQANQDNLDNPNPQTTV